MPQRENFLSGPPRWEVGTNLQAENIVQHYFRGAELKKLY
jgi:hypothetical protein